jgi:hypothetical protein
MLPTTSLGATIFGTVRGIVHDPSHRPVQSAHVTLRSLSSAWSRDSETDDDGGFVFSAVPAGQYEVTITREGFAAIADRVTVASGSAPLLHLQLTLESGRQSVVVSDVASGIDPESMSLQP